MPRRASSGIQPQALVIGLAVLVILLGGGYFAFVRKSSGFDAPELKIEQALRNSRSLSGNRYQTTGKLVDRRIEPEGQVIFLQMGGESNLKHLPIIIPDNFSGGNLNLETNYTFLIEFNTDGVAVAFDVKQL